MAKNITRRGAIGTAAAVAGFAIVQRVNAQSQFDWMRFKGTSLEIAFSKGPKYDLLQANQKEFEELTGIKVSSEQIPEQQYRQKLMLELASGHPSLDLANVALHVQKRLMAKGGWLLDLRPFMADASLTNPDFDRNDLSRAGMEFATQSDGKIDTIPYDLSYWILYCNKEIFSAKGLKLPTTIDEIVSAAAALNDPAKGIAGFTSRGLKNANVPVWSTLLLGQDTSCLVDGRLNTSSDAAIWAATVYQKLNKDYAPPGTVGFNWNECQTTFSQGRAAMWLDGCDFATPLENPKQSRVVGKVAYLAMPKGPRAQVAGTFADGLGVVATSKKREATWFYIQWATNKKNELRMAASGAGAPSRDSAFLDKEVIAKASVPKEWFDANAKSAEIGRPALPMIIPVQEFRDVFGIALTNMIEGADPATELKKATETFKPILEKSEAS
jgi:multiple sugar transport system substrate-binding protein